MSELGRRPRNNNNNAERIRKEIENQRRIDRLASRNARNKTLENLPTETNLISIYKKKYDKYLNNIYLPKAPFKYFYQLRYLISNENFLDYLFINEFFDKITYNNPDNNNLDNYLMSNENYIDIQNLRIFYDTLIQHKVMIRGREFEDPYIKRTHKLILVDNMIYNLIQNPHMQIKDCHLCGVNLLEGNIILIDGMNLLNYQPFLYSCIVNIAYYLKKYRNEPSNTVSREITDNYEKLFFILIKMLFSNKKERTDLIMEIKDTFFKYISQHNVFGGEERKKYKYIFFFQGSNADKENSNIMKVQGKNHIMLNLSSYLFDSREDFIRMKDKKFENYNFKNELDDYFLIYYFFLINKINKNVFIVSRDNFNWVTNHNLNNKINTQKLKIKMEKTQTFIKMSFEQIINIHNRNFIINNFLNNIDRNNSMDLMNQKILEFSKNIRTIFQNLGKSNNRLNRERYERRLAENILGLVEHIQRRYNLSNKSRNINLNRYETINPNNIIIPTSNVSRNIRNNYIFSLFNKNIKLKKINEFNINTINSFLSSLHLNGVFSKEQCLTLINYYLIILNSLERNMISMIIPIQRDQINYLKQQLKSKLNVYSNAKDREEQNLLIERQINFQGVLNSNPEIIRIREKIRSITEKINTINTYLQSNRIKTSNNRNKWLARKNHEEQAKNNNVRLEREQIEKITTNYNNETNELIKNINFIPKDLLRQLLST